MKDDLTHPLCPFPAGMELFTNTIILKRLPVLVVGFILSAIG